MRDRGADGSEGKNTIEEVEIAQIIEKGDLIGTILSGGGATREYIPKATIFENG